MPVYEYRCKSCETKYEVFYKVKEELDKVKCPECDSQDHKKLLSGFSATVTSESQGSCATGSCGIPAGGCAPGMCGLN